MTLSFPIFSAGMLLSLSLIMAIGPQNAHVLRMGLQRQHLWLTVAVCALSDVGLIALGVLGLAQLGGLSDRLQGMLIGAGVLFLLAYGWQAWRRFRSPLPGAGQPVTASPVQPMPQTPPGGQDARFARSGRPPPSSPMTLNFSVFSAGITLALSLIMAIGPQNAHVLRMGLQRRHLWLTVAVCVLADMALIALGVLGLAQLGGLPDKVHGALIGAGTLFLIVYGWQAFQRLRSPPAATPAGAAPAEASPGAPGSRQQAVMAALAFSWLNPHAWLDTAVLIGTASLAYGPSSEVFGLGAATGSLIWFTVLGSAALWLGQRLNSLHIWRVLDGLVALMMWGTAIWLLMSLF